MMGCARQSFANTEVLVGWCFEIEAKVWEECGKTETGLDAL
jgi:hypothetical protein